MMTIFEARTYLLQTGLKAEGFDPGDIDGDEGPDTRAALAAFLAHHQGTAGTIAGRMVALARGEVGVRESPANSNRGKRVQEYQKATNLAGTGWAWCAAFICWLAREAGMEEGRRPTTAGAWDFERWAKTKKATGVTLYKPANKTRIQPGDILVFNFSHIGLAVGSQGSESVATIEGNTDASGGREGGGVYQRTRRLDEIRSVIRIA